MVDEAKAFCPVCDNVFVEEEKREVASEYEKMDHTVQFGKTMYDLMLSDMGLNISKTPEPAPKRVEVVLAAAAPPPAPAKPAEKSVEKPPEKPRSASNKKWFILGGVVLALGFFLVAVSAIIGYIYWTRFR